MNRTKTSRRWIPLACFGLVLFLPVVSEACIVLYLDAWEDSGYVHGSVFVEDYYDYGSCYYDVIGEWTYWEHSYDAEVYIESPTQNTASDSGSQNNVAYGGGSAGADAFISTTGDHGTYTVGLGAAIACTVAGSILAEEEEPQVQSCVVPDGETTSWHGWATSDGTIGLWRGTLFDSMSTNFQGRSVTEQDPGGGGPDTCDIPGDGVLPFEAITGGTWPVGAGNVWGAPNGSYDGIGWGSNLTTYYRNQGQTPCGTTFSQRMEISCPSGPDQDYEFNGLGAAITDTNVTSCRAGSCMTHPWP